jgi:hypothetical protein
MISTFCSSQPEIFMSMVLFYDTAPTNQWSTSLQSRKIVWSAPLPKTFHATIFGP